MLTKLFNASKQNPSSKGRHSINRNYATTPGKNTAPANPKEGVNWDEMSFALTPTDYMYVSRSSKGTDFAKGELQPYGPMQIYPSATVLNYGQGIFEGIKAFRTSKNRIVVFRPKDNGARFNRGAASFCMPKVPENVFLDGIASVVKANSHWVPPEGKGALYLRPLLFGDGPQLGVRPSDQYSFVVWASPVGPYFKSGVIKPIDLLVTTDVHRAPPKGSGHVKAIGNYAPVFKVQQDAKAKGYSEVIFLDARYERFVEEAGASNFFCYAKNELRTPSLGAILEGVTRDSVMQLAKANGINVVAEKIDIKDVLKSEEVFCTGTGASITPVGSITWKDQKQVFNDGNVGKVTASLYRQLQDIQHERTVDNWNWLFDPFKA